MPHSRQHAVNRSHQQVVEAIDQGTAAEPEPRRLNRRWGCICPSLAPVPGVH